MISVCAIWDRVSVQKSYCHVRFYCEFYVLWQAADGISHSNFVELARYHSDQPSLSVKQWTATIPLLDRHRNLQVSRIIA